MCCIHAKFALDAGGTPNFQRTSDLRRSPPQSETLKGGFPDRFGTDGLPEGWDTTPLLDLANWDNGAAYKNMHFSDESDALPVVKIAELKPSDSKLPF